MSIRTQKNLVLKPHPFSFVLYAVLIGFTLALCVFLFIPKPDVYHALNELLGLKLFDHKQQESWFLSELWNVGHFLLFFCLAFLFGKFACARYNVDFLSFRYLLFIFLLLVGLGWLVEHIQIQVGRSFAYSDLALDALGTLAGLCLYLSIRSLLKVAIFIGLCALGLSSLIQASVDLGRMHMQFPVLFDHPDFLSIKRFSGNATLNRVEKNGTSYLEVEFGTDYFSGISLTEMKHDWSGYHQLVIALHNPSQNPLTLACRIHDSLHKDSGNDFKDRFNQKMTVEPGDNRFSFNLSAVQALPSGRAMDMRSIEAVMCFATGLEAPRKLVLDRIYLQ